MAEKKLKYRDFPASAFKDKNDFIQKHKAGNYYGDPNLLWTLVGLYGKIRLFYSVQERKMEIKIQLKNGKVLCFLFGNRTKWFEQCHLFGVMIEEYENHHIVYAWNPFNFWNTCKQNLTK